MREFNTQDQLEDAIRDLLLRTTLDSREIVEVLTTILDERQMIVDEEDASED